MDSYHVDNQNKVHKNVEYEKFEQHNNLETKEKGRDRIETRITKITYHWNCGRILI